MSEVVYRCRVCHREYDPVTASQFNFTCCDTPLRREASSRRTSVMTFLDRVREVPETLSGASPWVEWPATSTLSGSQPLFGTDEEMVTVKIIPPRENQKDALVMENLLGSLSVSPVPFSLEIIGEMGERSLQVRGSSDMVEHIIEQLQAAYGQVECERQGGGRFHFQECLHIRGAPEVLAELRDELQAAYGPVECEALEGRSLQVRGPGEIVEHIAERLQTAPQVECEMGDGLVRAQGVLTLRRDEMYPVRTWEEFREGDPIATLLGAFGGLKGKERVLSQLVLSPAPDGWADHLQGAAQEIDWRLKKASFPGQMLSLLFALGLGGGFFYLIMALSLLSKGRVVLFLGLTLLAGVLGYLMWHVHQHFSRQLSGDPRVIQRKVSRPAFCCQLRLTAQASEARRAHQLLAHLVGAYRLFNLAEGNGFQFRQKAFDVGDLRMDRGFLFSLTGASTCVLNTAELAGLWHLPMEQDVELLRRALFRRFLPLPEEVGERPGSIHIGHSIHHGRTFPVHLPSRAAEGNMLLVAKTQQGKSTLLQHLAAAAFQDPTRSVVVIDPHSDLVRSLLELVPEKRIGDVIYIDLGQEVRSVGINIFDVEMGVARDKVVADLIRIGEKLWPDYWGPRMEDALRYTSLALVEANEHLVRLGESDRQFTLLDIPFFLTLGLFRRDILAHHVSDRHVQAWWANYFEPLESNFRQQIINPVQTKIHRFMASHAARNVVGQSVSTVNLNTCLTERKIVLMNTASGIVGVETGAFLGAMLLNYLEAAIRSQQEEVRERRVPVTCLIDEFQSIPGVDYAALLGELRKMGANFALATQTLAQLDAVDRTLRASVLANIDSLMVFQTSAEDARTLSYELDRTVEIEDIINLDRFQCYLKTVAGDKRLPVLLVNLLPPLQGNRNTALSIMGQMASYTRSEDEVQRALLAHMLRYYHLDDRGQQHAGALEEELISGGPEELPMTETELMTILEGEDGEPGRRMRPRNRAPGC